MVKRGDKEETVTLKLGERDAPAAQAPAGPPVMGVTLKRGEGGVVFGTVQPGGAAATRRRQGRRHLDGD